MWFRIWILFKAIRRDVVMLLIACRNPNTPRHLKALFWGALLYFICPIDFLPDYLPVIGAVDDLTLVPAVLYYVSRMLPPEVKRESEIGVMKAKRRLPYLLWGGATLIILWIAFLIWGIYSLVK